MGFEKKDINAAEVLRRYQDLPAFSGIELTDVNQVGLFGERPLDIAAVRGDLREISALLEGGADLNSAGEHGNTALHEAVSQGHLAAVKLFVDAGADISIKNEFGQTPFDIAHSRNQHDLLSVLSRTKSFPALG
jgi:uncharacterized protein